MMIYCDYTASGRSLRFIEDFILQEVLPSYGNTHTSTSTTSLQTTLFRNMSLFYWKIVFHHVYYGLLICSSLLIFAGHGCTGAVHKLIHALNLSEPPVVFVGPCEHHSNLLPWRDIGAKILRIGESKEGFLDLHALECQLQAHQGLGRQLIGCFSAASNITGLLADDVATTLLLHQYGALAFWDYAAAAPYVKLDMNPLLHGVDEKAVYKDAMFFSVHKFVGGVQTPGVLVAKKALFRNTVPNGCGGGTVFFVTRDDHRYLQDVELREEGGTAAIVESVRAGLAMQLKESVGVPTIMAKEEDITKTVLAHIRTIPELLLLGSPCQTAQRLPVFSFLVRHPRGTFLHHNFVCTVLNDVFGVQARGGCACAGPYAQDLLGIDPELAKEYESVLLEDSRLDRTHLRRREEHSSYEMLRPGFARISLPFFMPGEEVAFVLEALKMVFKDRKWLGSVNYEGGVMNFPEIKLQAEDTLPQDYADVLQTARNIFNKARKMAQRYPLADQCVLFDESTEKLRWFMLPSEAQDLLLGNSQNVKHSVPFDPMAYDGSRASPIPPMSPPRVTVAPDFDSRNSPVHFTVGGYVDPANLTPVCMSTESELTRFPSIMQNTSLNSPVNLSPMPSFAAFTLDRHRHCSCSSQTDLHALDKEPSSPSESSSPVEQSPEMLQAYVTEVTKELATEIKSEIREVISQVQDVLDDSGEMSDGPMERPRSSSLSLRSAEEVAEYLVEASQRLASEMKSELREVVSAVDVLIYDDGGESKRSGTPPCLSAVSRSSAFLSSPELSRRMFPRPRLNSASASSPSLLSPVSSPNDESPTSQQQTPEPKLSSECESDETVIYVAPKSPSVEKDSQTEETTGGEEDEQETDSTKKKQNRVTSISSQDSGINVSFQEAEAGSGPKCQANGKCSLLALQEFEMVKNGDRVLLCLSGGKDSLSLLHTLHQYQFYAKSKGINFTLGAATVDPGSTAYDPRPLIPYLKALGVPYFYEEQNILQKAASLSECRSVCSFCSRMKRGRLYATARREGYNVLALGQHLDDLAESFLMSVFHNGRLRTMKANYSIREKDLRVIRPFVYVREKSLRHFAENRKLPVIPENCPACFEAPKERHRTKQLLAQQEILFPRLFWSLRSALHPLMSVRRTGVESRLFSRPLNSSQSSESEEETPSV
ncbi:hypothetical protein B566_EDAN003126 [Ephemera danica]|nr:hypothetical protein B566_EDAN003126 [Ephemera danica]